MYSLKIEEREVVVLAFPKKPESNSSGLFFKVI